MVFFFRIGPNILPLLLPLSLLLLFWPPSLGAPSLDESKCRRVGDRFVQDYIQYECAVGSSSSAEDGSGGGDVNFDNGVSVFGGGGPASLIGKPIGCVPSNKTDGTVIRPGVAHTTRHFRYECSSDAGNAIALKVTHCIDHQGKLVKVGEFFTEPAKWNGGGGGHGADAEEDDGDLQQQQFTTVECVGNELLAKKVIHRWSNCELPNGKKLVEGDFTLQDLPKRSLRSHLQKFEIVACLHEEGDVRLKCTGCVATNGQELAISRFTNVAGQWTQCRRFKEGCRLINVTSDYIDCEYEGQIHKHGSTFESGSRRSLFICSHGQIIKQGCFIQGKELTLVGDVKYIDGVTPALCVDSDNFTLFNGIVGCDLADGRFKRFMEVWRDSEGQTMKRCSWAFNPDGTIARAEIRTFACLDGAEQIPLNKVVQKDNGQFVKCAPLTGGAADEGGGWRNAAGGGEAANLLLRNLTEGEFIELTTKKLARQNLVEYFGIGRRAAPLLTQAKALAAETKTSGNCSDLLAFCARLSGYCSFMTGPLERGLALESYSELKELQSRFEQFGQGTKNGGAASGEQQLSLPAGCEKQPSSFQKLQMVVELACPRTCQKCSEERQRESTLSSLENSAHCGK